MGYFWWTTDNNERRLVVTDTAEPPDSPTAVPMKSLDSCNSCSALETCTGAQWNEGGYSPHGADATHALNMVHTCVACSRKVLSDLIRISQPVPADCPRWGVHAGCGIHCGECRVQLEEIEKRHPHYEDQTQAMLAMFSAPTTPDEFTKYKHRKEVMSRVVTATCPTRLLQDQDEQTQLIVYAIVDCVAEEFIETVFWKSITDEIQMLCRARMAEALVISTDYHEWSPVAVAWDLVLFVSNKMPLSRVWAMFDTKKKKNLQRHWENVIEASMKAGGI